MNWPCEPTWLGASGSATGTAQEVILHHQYRCPAGGRTWREDYYHELGQPIR